MSETQRYIGARYVPKFYENSLDPTSTLWEPNVMYEPLTVVTVDNNHTYISKKFVPDDIGSPALNAEYWLDQGSYNAYIQELQDQIDVIDGNIGDMTDLDVGDNTNLVDAINSVAHTKYIFIGDSYGHGSGSDGWIPRIINIMGLTSDDYYEAAAGGYGFGGEDNFLDLLQGLTIEHPEDIDQIVVLGGANDYYFTQTQIETGIATFVSYCKTHFVNAKVRIGMIAANANRATLGLLFNKVLRAYSNCSDAEFLNNLQYAMHDYSLIGPDNVHPTSEGYAWLSKKIVQALNGGCSINFFDKNGVVLSQYWTPYINGADTEVAPVSVTVNNNITSLALPSRFGQKCSNSAGYKNITSGHFVTVGTLQSKYARGSSEYDLGMMYSSVKVTAIVGNSDNLYSQIEGVLYLKDNRLEFLSFDRYIGDHPSYFQNVNFIQIMGPVMVGDSMFF